MADGSSRYLVQEWTVGEARLGWATAARSSLWARCACGREATVDDGVARIESVVAVALQRVEMICNQTAGLVHRQGSAAVGGVNGGRRQRGDHGETQHGALGQIGMQ